MINVLKQEVPAEAVNAQGMLASQSAGQLKLGFPTLPVVEKTEQILPLIVIDGAIQNLLVYLGELPLKADICITVAGGEIVREGEIIVVGDKAEASLNKLLSLLEVLLGNLAAKKWIGAPFSYTYVQDVVLNPVPAAPVRA